MYRSQRALLKVLTKIDDKACDSVESTKIDDKACDSVESTHHSTAWSERTLTESVSYIRSSSSSRSVVSDVRNSRSAERPSDVKSQPGQTVTVGVKQVHHRSPVAEKRCSVRGAVKQSKRGRRVQVELLSNWGHERLVGLTEIELLDASDSRIDIHPLSDVNVCASNAVSRIDALFNGKCKV